MKNPWIIALLALFCTALCGSATPFIKLGYQFSVPEKDVPSTILYAGMRFFFAGIITVLTYLAFLSATAYAIWGLLLKSNPVSKVTIYSFMTPVMGVILSSIMLSEQSGVSPINLAITLIFVCTGILILNYKKEK